jgi:hypothetical protein
MPRARACVVLDPTLDSCRDPPIVQKRDVLLPREADHRRKAVLVREIEEPPRRRFVEADCVDADCRHCGKVRIDSRAIRVRDAVRAGPKGPVRDAANVLLRSLQLEETGFDSRPEP